MPINMSIKPPRIPAFPDNLVPAFFPIIRPMVHITNVTAAITRADISAYANS